MKSRAECLSEYGAPASIVRRANLHAVEEVDGRGRAVVDYVGPEVDGGRFPVKRAVGETVAVVAHAFADGHDRIRVEMLYRRSTDAEWSVREIQWPAGDSWATDTPKHLRLHWRDAFSTMEIPEISRSSTRRARGTVEIEVSIISVTKGW